MKTKLAIILTLCLSTALTGCYDIKEIDETAYIVALGIDKNDNSNYSYTFQFSSPLALSSSGETDKPSPSESSGESSTNQNSTVTNLTIEAPGFYVARNMTNNFISKNVDMSHLKLIVFSHKISADELESHSQLLLREREVRPHTSIAVSAIKASDYLEKVNPELETNTSKYYELMSLHSNNVYAPPKRLHDFVDDLSAESHDTILPIATNGKSIHSLPKDRISSDWIGTSKVSVDSDSSVLYGMAIYKNGKLSDTMDGDSSMIFNILNKNIETCTVTVKDRYTPDRTLSFRIIVPEKASYYIDRKQKQITVSQSLKTEFLGSVLPEGYKSFDELYSYIQNMITNRITEFLTDISTVKKADILKLRNCMRNQFTTWKQWRDFDWDNFYRQAKFTVNINPK